MRSVTIRNTVCPRDCYDTCSLITETTDRHQKPRIRGDPTNPITQGFTCPRGAKDLDRVFSKDRILQPHLHHKSDAEGSFRRCSWDEALDTVVRRLQQTLEEEGSEAVLHLEYAGNMGLLTWYFPQRLWNAIGATKTDYSVCGKSGHDALNLHYGRSHGIELEELLNQRFIIFWGFNPAVSAPHIWSLARQAQIKQKAKIGVIDPRQSKSTKTADLWLQPQPGSDVALTYGIAHYLIEHNLIDKEFINKWTQGFDHFVAEAEKWTPKRVERVTGIKKPQLTQFAAAYGELRPNTTLIGLGMQKSLQGAEGVRAISLLPALLGLHRGFFYSNGRAHTVNFDYITGASLAEEPPRVVSQVALANLIAQGTFKFIYIYNMNPALTLPNQRIFRQGLVRQDVFVVVHETHWTETTQFADVVLPAPTYLEKEDIVIPWGHHYVKISNQILKPLGESQPETWVMHELAKRLNLDQKWVFEDPWKVVESALKDALLGGTFKDLMKGERLTLNSRPINEYPTPSGKIEFYSKLAHRQGISPLPAQQPLDKLETEFLLLNSALQHYTHTQFQDVYGPIPAIVWINPENAKTLRIQTDDEIMLANELGQISVKAQITDAVPKGILWSPRQFLGLNNTPQNTLAPDITQQIGGGSTFNSFRVRIINIKK